MPDAATRADSIREYLTGAGSDGGVQTDPDASLGGYRSASQVVSMGIVVEDAIPEVTIDFAGGGNTPGEGTLDAVDADTLRWKCSGGDYGVSVAIANGETKLLETALLPGAYLRVTRTSTVDLSGTATVTLTRQRNNPLALDDVGNAESTAGDTEYRATMLKNVSSGTVFNVARWIGELGTSAVSDAAQLVASGAGLIRTTGSLADWPDQGWVHVRTSGGTTREIAYYSQRTDTVLTVPSDGRGRLGTTPAAGAATDTIHAVPGIAIAIDTDGVTSGGAAIQTIADESTAPSSVSWSVGITEATGLAIGDMDSGEQVGIWVKREIPPGAVGTAWGEVLVEDLFDAA